MSGELSRSLVDAAARRLAARDVADRDMDAFETECEYAEKQHYLGMGAVAVAAVLETLAAHYEHDVCSRKRLHASFVQDGRTDLCRAHLDMLFDYADDRPVLEPTGIRWFKPVREQVQEGR